MKQVVIKLIAPLLCLIGLWSCSDDEPSLSPDNKQWTEKVVAVVLPMEKGLDVHWKRTLGMFTTNFERAFKNHEAGIRLKFEYYDEAKTDVRELARSLAFNDEVYAVIGGLYSSNAAILAAELTIVGKTFFTLATAEQLVRAYASTGYLWAMTETDITQCEVLLSKVINYEGKSVALLVKENDGYGQTFIDWFAFQARELGLENMGCYAYTSDNIADVSRQAMQSGAEYVICIPSEIEEMKPMLEAHKAQSLNGRSVPRMLFSDTAYGADVLKIHGDAAEGIEGVAFGADPESGFDVSYRTFFNATPTLGESQLYDAAMLIGYAAWYQQFRPELSLQKSLRAVVSGEGLNMGSWTGEDMGLVVDALAAGKSPYVRGASGHLRFDAKCLPMYLPPLTIISRFTTDSTSSLTITPATGGTARMRHLPVGTGKPPGCRISTIQENSITLHIPATGHSLSLPPRNGPITAIRQMCSLSISSSDKPDIPTTVSFSLSRMT